jgi:hypothetical protein
MFKRVGRINKNAILAGVMAGMVILTNACIPGRYLAVTDSSGNHRHIKIKFVFQDQEKKQSGKIIMKFDRNRTRLVFLSSLNQVYFELFVEKDMAWLINTREKKFWNGKFRELIKEMWNLDLSMEEFKLLLSEGIVPEKKLKSAGFDYSIQTDEASGTPLQVRLSDSMTTIILKIQNQSVRSGGIPFDADFSRLRKSDLSSVLNWE